MEEEKSKNETKKPHPGKEANVLSKLLFMWMIPTFVKGFKKPLDEEDIYGNLNSHDSVLLGDKMQTAWEDQLRNGRTPSLWRAVFTVFRGDIIKTGFGFLVIEFGIKLGQPICISKLMAYYTPNQTTMTLNDAYFYAGMVVLLSFLQVLCIHSNVLCLQHLGMKIRVAMCSLIYRKALRLSKSAMMETTVGQMVNLLSNDVSRFDQAMVHFHNVWGAPVLTVIVLYLLYDRLGVTSLTGVAFLLIFIPLQLYMGKRTSVYRLRTAIRTDERVRLMNEIISGIQVIKMYTWEKPFSKLVEIARKKEIKEICNNSMLRALMLSFNLFINRVAIYLCILTYFLCGNKPNHEFVFVCTSFYGILRMTVTMHLPQAVTMMAESNVSVKRIEKFLNYDEVVDSSNSKSFIVNGATEVGGGKKDGATLNGIVLTEVGRKSEPTGIKITNGTVGWAKEADATLTNVDFKVASDQLVAVVGPVGSGKTTLLHAILRELPLQSGSIDVHGTVSYCSQEPWLFVGSIRQNILFGQKYDERKYNEVVRVCALQRDFSLFAYGDRTTVGERGVMLSGGQRARINLARTVYKDADIYLLDDPLSAVDTHVGKQLFDECITKYLAGKCVVLVTHQLQYLHKVSRIDLLEDGKITVSGTYEQLQNSGRDFTKLLDEHKEEHHHEAATAATAHTKDRKSKEIGKSNGDGPVQMKEQIQKGKLNFKVYVNYFVAGGGLAKATLMLIIFVTAQILGSGNDYFITQWVNYEQDRTTNTTNNTSTLADELFADNHGLYIYSAFACMVIVFTITRSVLFYRFCMTASRIMHNSMFNNIVNATMKFFNTNPSGRILNRFSKDMGAIDENLPMTMIDTLQIGLTVLGITLVVGSVNPWILMPTVVILAIFYGLRVVFLASSRNIKRMEGTTRSPVFSHLSASLQGLTTIRAFGAQDILKDEFDKHQNLHSAVYYMFLAANRTFGFWLDFHCVVYIGLVTVSLLFIQQETYGGNVGLALTQSTLLCGMFQWGMRQWSELENQMTSVERVLEYTELTPENDRKIKEPPKFWPEQGNIRFDGVSMRYSENEPYVLKDLNFNVRCREKVGIVGRTGAGKSSLISALFRLCEVDGKILIDDVNTKEIRLRQLRSKISIIPQEPVLFSGTLRKNLDPFDEFSDDVIWNALEEVELKSAVAELPSGLDSKMSEGGSNFSVGQRQLVCLARALIRRNKILVLDEATANVDPQTDVLIQTTIRNKFKDCTVLTIAHRLHTVMDSDKVLVMDAGRVAEFGHPHELLQKREGIFYGLVQQTGKAMAANLTSIAELTFNFQKDK